MESIKEPKECPKGWPFRAFNGHQTLESKALEGLPLPKPLKGLKKAFNTFNDDEDKEALL
jgi:hypothetical protein